MDPAHAGMILDKDKELARLRDGPRACGDDPADGFVSPYYKKWTPRMRG